ncbi:TetR/AcrR family transcriptional regulator [Marmoricola sp. RAF53]|uniref:TetR/AcrR family transcriptional regulator n=1 Tax=Marmoricola sp. RAF53 TaxID=3233059 RepID=UPI003F9AC9DE
MTTVQSSTPAPGPTTREQTHAATKARIVAAARTLLVNRGEVTLRAIARELGMTAPALYRYAPSHEELVRTVAIAIDADVAERITRASDAQPAEDPAARLIAATVEFRQWALTNREEFALVFTNVDVDCIDELTASASTGMKFSELLFTLWAAKPFPVPALDELDPGLAEILRDPAVPADLTAVPDELRGLVWVLERAWSRLYGTVTLEVFRHIDPRIVEQAHLFRAMVEDQAEPLGLVDDLPRLRVLISELLATGG